MSCGLSGRYDSATIFATQCNDREQDVTASHSDDLNPLLVIDKSDVDLFDTVRVFQGSDGIRKIHTVFAKIRGGFVIIPFVLHTKNSTGYR